MKERPGWGMPLLSGTPPSPACHNGLEIQTYKHEWIFLPLSRSARRQQRLRGTQEARLPYLTTLVRWWQVTISDTNIQNGLRQSSRSVHEGKFQTGFTEVESMPLNVGIAIPRAGSRPEWKDIDRVPSLQPWFLTTDALWPARNRKQNKRKTQTSALNTVSTNDPSILRDNRAVQEVWPNYKLPTTCVTNCYTRQPCYHWPIGRPHFFLLISLRQDLSWP